MGTVMLRKLEFGMHTHVEIILMARRDVISVLPTPIVHVNVVLRHKVCVLTLSHFGLLRNLLKARMLMVCVHTLHKLMPLMMAVGSHSSLISSMLRTRLMPSFRRLMSFLVLSPEILSNVSNSLLRSVSGPTLSLTLDVVYKMVLTLVLSACPLFVKKNIVSLRQNIF